MRTLPRLLGLLALGLFLAVTPACDSDNDVEVTPEDVEGTYAFLEFSFVPDADRIPSVDARESLEEDDTELVILSSGQARLDYDFEDGPSGFLTGSVSVDEDEVRISLNNENGAREQLLLPQSLRLTRESEDVLTTIRTRNGERTGLATTANLELFDPDGFAGFTSVPGELFITLER